MRGYMLGQKARLQNRYDELDKVGLYRSFLREPANYLRRLSGE